MNQELDTKQLILFYLNSLKNIIVFADQLWESTNKERQKHSGIKKVLAHHFFQKGLTISFSTMSVIDSPERTDLNEFQGYKDFISAMILTRAVFENYINMNYLLASNLTWQEQMFRYLLFKKHGWYELKKLKEWEEDTPEEIEGTENNLNIFLNKIKRTNHYQTLKDEEKSNAISPEEWSIHESNKIAGIAGFNMAQVKYIKKVFSSHIHSFNYSLKMIELMNSGNEIYAQMTLPLMYTSICLTLTIEKYASVLGLNLNEHIKELIQLANKLKSKNIKSIFLPTPIKSWFEISAKIR